MFRNVDAMSAIYSNIGQNIRDYRRERRTLWNTRNYLNDIYQYPPFLCDRFMYCDPYFHSTPNLGSPRKSVDLSYVEKDGDRVVDQFDVTEANCEMPRGLKEKIWKINDYKNFLQEIYINKEIYGRGIIQEKRKNLLTGCIDNHERYKNMLPCERYRFLRDWNFKILQNKYDTHPPRDIYCARPVSHWHEQILEPCAYELRGIR